MNTVLFLNLKAYKKNFTVQIRNPSFSFNLNAPRDALEDREVEKFLLNKRNSEAQLCNQIFFCPIVGRQRQWTMGFMKKFIQQSMRRYTNTLTRSFLDTFYINNIT